MRTLTQSVTTSDYLSGRSLGFIAGCITLDRESGDMVGIEIIDGCPVVDQVDIRSVPRYCDGPIFPTDGGDWMELHGSLRAIIAIHILRMGYSLFVYGRHEISLEITC